MNIFITGASSGIGLAFAQEMLDQNHQVVVTVRKPEDKQRLEALGCFVLLIDLADIELIQPMFKQVLEYFNQQVDIVINNAAFGQVGALEDVTVVCLKRQFDVNFFAVHEITRCAIKQMRKQTGGKIVQVSSVLGIVSMKMRGAYNSSKYALDGLCDTLRLELQDTNIHISLIEPGPITSNFRKNALDNFEKTIDIENSVHSKSYQIQLARLKKVGPAAKFTLPASACVDKLNKIIKSKRPAPRYYVTFPMHLFGLLKRILSTRMLDRILGKSG
ncbi:MAG: SDR family NAD(P)-dependent oxidoreductase [Saccharospirillaceae bacterium]|nr:SDR family NAD(P)-dependent oxidoreductase [Pseudomonadales bacterium]NRB77973.1 SDR family NAD(P)-dependent oxidoreductase [Saccharospirillaceae bacterium]